MYTQCPECGVAFRVTAEVLRQAAGKVRCGGCGSAFNALEHLSEQKPSAPVRSAPQPRLPELTPEEPPGELEADTPPQSISAAQSAALLKTLDQLAGSDIRIEDTGVEWRVLDDVDDEDEDDSDDGSVDELLEESPTPVDEFLTATPPAIDAPEVFEEMRFDDNTPLPDDFDIAPPAAKAVSNAAEPEEIVEKAQADLDLGDPEDWEDLLDEVAVEALSEPEAEDDDSDDANESVAGLVFESEADLESVDVVSGPEDDVDLVLLGDQPPDIDTQFGIQAEALGISTNSLRALEEESLVDEGGDDDDEIDIELEEAEEDALVDEIKGRPVDEGSLTVALDDESVAEAVFEEPYIPEMTEEEKTINMLIDQDLLSVAVEDEDGFATTIIQRQPGRKVESEIRNIRREGTPEESDDEDDGSAAPARADNPLVETIIMEGHEVKDIASLEKHRENRKLGEKIKAEAAKNDRQVFDFAKRRKTTIAASVALAILLLLQIVHQSREALATIPALNRALGPVYRMLGAPLTPAYDVQGWRFEATKGEAGEDEALLTIYSRIGNDSDSGLPYPLVHVALTDRFEDIIGSRVLEPAEYLADGDDPRELVPAGNSFNAVISVDTPSADATGFRLDVCYRLASRQLRCAIEDFK